MANAGKRGKLFLGPAAPVRRKRPPGKSNKGFMTFDRGVALANLALLVMAGVWAGLDAWDKSQLSENEIKIQRQTLISLSDDIDVETIKTYPDGSHLYDISFHAKAINNGKFLYETDVSLNQLFVGTIESKELNKGDALQINAPPTPFVKGSSKPIYWAQVSYVVDVSGPKQDKLSKAFEKGGWPGAEYGGGLTGILYPGVPNWYTYEYFLRSMPTNYISIVESLSGQTDEHLGSSMTKDTAESGLLSELDRRDKDKSKDDVVRDNKVGA